MGRFLLSLCCILLTQFVFAQQGIITGQVTNEKTGETLPGINIFIPEKGTGTTTNIDGTYQISLESGAYTLQFSFIGYEKQEITVSVIANETQTININLLEKSERLSIHVVSASQYRKDIAKETASIDLIQADQIKSRNVTNLGEALEKIPGVQVLDGQVSIRGGSSYSYGIGSRTAVLSDGIPLMNPDLGESLLKLAPTEIADQVEIIKGASSVIYGSSALNGIVNVQTAWPTSEEPANELSLFTTVFQAPSNKELVWWGRQPMSWGATFKHQRKVDDFQYLVGGNIFGLFSYLENNDEHRGKVFFKTRYISPKVKGLNFGVNGNVMYQDWGRFILSHGMGDAGYRNFEGSRDRFLRSSIDPHLSYQDNSGNRYRLKMRYLHNLRRGNGDDPNASAHSVYVENQYQKNIEDRWIITAGLPVSLSRMSSHLYDGRFTNWNAAAYIQTEYKKDRLSVVVGGRYEAAAVSKFVETDLPVFRAGMNYHLGKATFLRLSAGQAYRIPSIAERYIAEPLTDGILVIPNIKLDAERGWSAEFGVKQGITIGNWQGYVDASLFWQEYDKFVEYALGAYENNVVDENGELFFGPEDEFIPGLLLGMRAFNVNRARIAGYEVSVLGQGKIGKVNVNTLFGYTYNYPGNIEDDSTLLNVKTYLGHFFGDMFTRLDSSDVYTKPFDPVNGTDSTRLLQFRSRHIFNGDIEFGYKRFSFGLSAAYASFPERIPSLFNLAVEIGELAFIEEQNPEEEVNLVSAIATQNETTFNQYIRDHEKGDLILDFRLGYELNDRVKLAFLVKNMTHRIYARRPGILDAPRNFTLKAQFNL